MTKEFFAPKVRDYAVNAIDKVGDDKAKLSYFFWSFEQEYNFEYNRKRYGGIQNVLREYLLGLPSTINIAFTYHEIEKLLREWGYIKDKASEKQIEKELDAYWNYIAMALVVEARRAKIENITGL